MPVEAEDIAEMLARVQAREEKAKRELEDAETKTERQEIRERIEALEARNAELEVQLAAASKTAERPDVEDDSDDDGDSDSEAERKPRMRKGRKHGNVYQDTPGGVGYVYQGDDEPDLVPVDEEDAA